MTQDLVADPLTDNPVVESFVRRWIRVPPALDGRIHPQDEMHRFGLASLRGSGDCAAILYYLKGYQIVRAVGAALAGQPGELAGVESLLDFASGFGRSTRFLVREVEPSRVWVTEIQPGAAAFQQEVFGVYAADAAEEPQAFEPGCRFACIVASSFFSHVAPARFEAWLERLLGLVEPGGLLLFSVHGETLAPAGASWSDGFLFQPESESRVLDPKEYGTTYVTEKRVREAVARATSGRGGVDYRRFGFCGHQDLCVASPDRGTVRGATVLFPRGDLLDLRSSSRLALSGWVSGPRLHGGDVTVALYVGSERRDYRVLSPADDDGDDGRALWSLETEGSSIAPDEVVAVTAVTSTGLENVLAMGTLRTAGLIGSPPRPASEASRG